jgi:predicted SprT family Zn-dependent metalloprotease
MSVLVGSKYPCRECDHWATENYNLKRHIETMHMGREYHCGKCDFKAFDKRSLHEHNKLKHTSGVCM